MYGLNIHVHFNSKMVTPINRPDVFNPTNAENGTPENNGKWGGIMFLDYNYETKTLTIPLNSSLFPIMWFPLENQTIDHMIEAAVPLIFNFDFPFYVERHPRPNMQPQNLRSKKTFCLQYFREQIGLETIGEFQYHLKKILTLNMPYYEQLYREYYFEYNPLITHKSTRKVQSIIIIIIY